MRSADAASCLTRPPPALLGRLFASPCQRGASGPVTAIDQGRDFGLFPTPTTHFLPTLSPVPAARIASAHPPRQVYSLLGPLSTRCPAVCVERRLFKRYRG